MVVELVVTAGCSLGAPTGEGEEQDTGAFTRGDDNDDRACGAPNDDPEAGGDPDDAERAGFAGAAAPKGKWLRG